MESNHHVLYTEQCLKYIERFGTNSSAPRSSRSVLAVDTTFNISSPYFMHTTPTVRKDNLKPPWFPVYFCSGRW